VLIFIHFFRFHAAKVENKLKSEKGMGEKISRKEKFEEERLKRCAGV